MGSKTYKSEKLKKMRRRVATVRSVFFLSCGFGIWLFVFWLFGLPSLTIHNLEIVGNVSLSVRDIATATNKFLTGRYFFTVPKESIFFYPKSAIAKSIAESFPEIKRAEIGIKNFNTLGISVAERTPSALWCVKNENLAGEKIADCYKLDDSSFIFSRATTKDSAEVGFVKFFASSTGASPIGQTYLSSAFFRSLMDFAKNFSALGFSVVAFRERSEREQGDFEAVLEGGVRLIFSRDSNLTSIFANVESIISDSGLGKDGFAKLDYLDLRFGNKIFYKMKK